MLIAIDLDNVILNSPTTIINLHNKLSDNKLEYKQGDSLGWKFEPLIKTDEELSELFKLFDHKDFYKDAITFPNAIEIINDLSMQHEICIISKHMESRKPLSREWISKTFLNVELKFVDSFSDKGDILKGYDIILDDRIDALDSCIGNVKYRICYGNYPWNYIYQGLRVTNWLEFKQFIDKLETLDKNKIK